MLDRALEIPTINQRAARSVVAEIMDNPNNANIVPSGDHGASTDDVGAVQKVGQPFAI